MAIQLDFSGAEAQRLRITQEQQEQIRDLYRQASAEVGKLAEQAPRVPSDALRQQYLHTLQGQIDEQLRDIESQLNGTIRSSMTDTVKATVTDAKAFLKENGLPIKGAYSHVPADIVRSVASGQLYTGNWTLSRALWLNTAETQHDVQSVIAQGIIQNKSAFDIAKDLEKYVNPDARKDWEWSKVYPGTKKVVDYNAQRLARTMVSHAYQQAFVRTTQKNPFVTKYKWEASNSGRVCEICEERDGKLFDKDDLPLDHPNGMCTFTAVMDNLDTIGERLGDWAAGKSDPELDKWAEDLYGKGWENKKRAVEPKANTKTTKGTTRVSDSVAGMTKIGDINKAVNSAKWFTTKTYFQGLDVETAQHLVAAYQRIFDRYPPLIGQFPAPNVGLTSNSSAYASCLTGTTGQITLNKQQFGSWQNLVSAYAKDVRLGFHPEGTTAESILTHEFGHALDGWLVRSGRVPSDTQYASTVLIDKAFEESGMSRSSVGFKVSSYAKKNDRECFAECFAQGMESGEKSSLTNALFKELDKLIGR